jgi:phenylpropionate dioxygenase-like ring-hydroxylating dioxygenase large terminal subunit
MVIESGLNIGDLVREDRVHARVYYDPDIFELELEKIWGRVWVYVAHESELTEPGDYKTAWIGTQPVIITRDADEGKIQVLFNRCRHRAATVCQDEQGNANYFRCAYHGWTYNNRGDLIGVPYRQGYGESFTYSEFGLVKVPRVDSYRGFIFASLSPTGPTLGEHLGNARKYIDQFIAQSPTDELVVQSGNQKYGVDINWKLQMENSVDNYHVTFVHQTAGDIMKRQVNAAGAGNEAMYAFTQKRIQESRVRDLGNGHGINDRPSGNDWHTLLRSSSDCRRAIESLEAKLGVEAAREMINLRASVPYTFNIFPNLVLISSMIRVLHPISVDRAELTMYPVLLKGVPDEINHLRMRIHEFQFGPAGFIGPDDAEIMDRVRIGMRAKGNEWILQARELGREEVDENGVRSGNIVGETGLRGMARAWKELMTAT